MTVIDVCLQVVQGDFPVKKHQALFYALALVLISTPVGRQSFTSFTVNNLFDSTRLIVKVKPHAKLPTIEGVEKSYNLFADTYVLKVHDFKKVESLLLTNTQVLSIHKNYFAKLEKSNLQSLQFSTDFTKLNTETVFKNNSSEHFNDPGVSSGWIFRDAQLFGISLNKAYRTFKNQPTATTIVAVIDTGVDYTHEDLKDIMWKNSKEIANNGIDDDKNGYIDDVYGINTSIRDENNKPSTEIKDLHFHGTHVSGIIAAKQNNGQGIAGIASNVKIMGLKVIPEVGDETDLDVAEAFIYAAKNGAKIINCSFGKKTNAGGNLIPDTLKYIADHYGVLVVAAAGNADIDIDKTPSYPASFENDNLLVVASTNDYDGGLNNSPSYGKVSVDVGAPGYQIYSTMPNNKYSFQSGVSMATPVVSGIAAEVWSRYPKLTYQELKLILMKSVTPSKLLRDKVASGGRVDLYNALMMASGSK